LPEPDTLPDLPQESAEELYENAPCGYVTTRPDGTIVRINRTFLLWTGFERDALLAGRRF
jgi:PAS domain-containing protein